MHLVFLLTKWSHHHSKVVDCFQRQLGAEPLPGQPMLQLILVFNLAFDWPPICQTTPLRKLKDASKQSTPSTHNLSPQFVTLAKQLLTKRIVKGSYETLDLLRRSSTA